MPPYRHRRVAQAWLALCLAVAIHVADEAATGFLSVYNPTVLAIRDRLSWFTLPVFRFDTWLAGLILAVGALVLLTAAVDRGARWTRVAAYVFAGIMLANALGHAAGTLFGRTFESVRFSRPMPGFWSSPLLAAASLHLIYRVRRDVPTESTASPTPRSSH